MFTINWVKNYLNYYTRNTNKKITVEEVDVSLLDSISDKFKNRSEENVISQLTAALLRVDKADEVLENPNFSGFLSELEMNVLVRCLDSYLNENVKTSFLTNDDRVKISDMIYSESILQKAIKNKDKIMSKKAKTTLNLNISHSLILMMFMFSVCSASICCGDTCEGSYLKSINVWHSSNGPVDNYIQRFVETGNETQIILCDSIKVTRRRCYDDDVTITGDESFCKIRNCTDDAECTCVVKYGSIKSYSISGEEISLKPDECFILDEEDDEPSGRRSRNVNGGCPAITRTFTDRSIIFTIDEVNDVTCSVTKDGHFQNMSPAKGLNTIQFDEEILKTSGYINFVVMHGDNICYKDDYMIKVSSQCQIYDCIYCTEVFSSLNCLPFTYKLSVMVMLILSGLCFLILLPCFWWIFTIVISMMKWPVSKSQKVISNRIRKFKENKTEDEDIESPKVKRRGGSSSKPISKMMMISMIVCVALADTETDEMTKLALSASSWSCSNGLDIGSASSCTTLSSSLESCSLKFSKTFEFTKPGKMCLSFSQVNRPSATVNISYVFDMKIFGVNHLYETGDYKTYQSSMHGCYGAGWCNDDNCNNCCSKRDANGFSSLVAMYPGVTQCRRSCSGLGCGTGILGCPIPRQSCVMQGYSFNAIGLTCQVYEPTVLSTIPIYLIEWFDKTGSRQNKIMSKFTIPPYGSNDFGITDGGSFQSDVTIFGDNKFITCNDSNSWYGPASSLGFPKGGGLGDIQANYLELHKNIFTYAKDIVSSVQSQTSTTYTFLPTGVSFLKQGQYTQLPGKIGTIDIKKAAELFTTMDLHGYDYNGGKALITFNSNNIFNVTKKVSVACPLVSNVESSGCYNCESGSKSVVTIKSTCGDGAVSLYVDDTSIQLFSPTFDITSSNADLIMSFYTTKSLNDFTVTMIAADMKTYSFQVKFAAKIENNVPITNDTKGEISESKGSSAFTFPLSWKDLIKGLTENNFFSIMILILVVIVGLILIYFFVKVLVKIIRETNAATRSKSKEK